MGGSTTAVGLARALQSVYIDLCWDLVLWVDCWHCVQCRHVRLPRCPSTQVSWAVHCQSIVESSGVWSSTAVLEPAALSVCCARIAFAELAWTLVARGDCRPGPVSRGAGGGRARARLARVSVRHHAACNLQPERCKEEFIPILVRKGLFPGVGFE